MPDNMVTIGGVSVDMDKPCDVLRELRKAQLVIATGESVAMTRFDQDEVRFTAGSATGLGALISDYERRCAAANGTRHRGARTVRWGRR